MRISQIAAVAGMAAAMFLAIPGTGAFASTQHSPACYIGLEESHPNLDVDFANARQGFVKLPGEPDTMSTLAGVFGGAAGTNASSALAHRPEGTLRQVLVTVNSADGVTGGPEASWRMVGGFHFVAAEFYYDGQWHELLHPHGHAFRTPDSAPIDSYRVCAVYRPQHPAAAVVRPSWNPTPVTTRTTTPSWVSSPWLPYGAFLFVPLLILIALLPAAIRKRHEQPDGGERR